MRIARVIIGVLEDGAPVVYQLEPNRDGLTVVATGSISADAIASSLRHALSRPEPRSSDPIPFVRIALEKDELALEVADDAGQAIRMLTESRGGALPLVIEAARDEDAELEALLARIATLAGLDEVEQLAPALAMGAEATPQEATPEELAFAEAQRRATRLAAAVRRVDDEMTASVVPDWLWIATGFGGLGVFLTAVVFLYPETRIFLIPALIVLSSIGFALYGWRSWKELQVRGRLQVERADLRERREAARAEARGLRTKLEELGRDPDAVMVRLQGIVIPRSVPAILARDASVIPELEKLDRQVVLFVDGSLAHAQIRPLVRFTGETAHLETETRLQSELE